MFSCGLHCFGAVSISSIKVIKIVCTAVTCEGIHLNNVDIKGLCIHFDHDSSIWYSPTAFQRLCVYLINDEPTPRSCCCPPEYIIRCWSTVKCPALVHLTSEKPTMLTFIRSISVMMRPSWPFWYIVRTFHVPMLIGWDVFSTVAWWRSGVTCDAWPALLDEAPLSEFPCTSLWNIEFCWGINFLGRIRQWFPVAFCRFVYGASASLCLRKAQPTRQQVDLNSVTYS